MTLGPPVAPGGERMGKYVPCAASIKCEEAHEEPCAGELLKLWREWDCVLFCRLSGVPPGRTGAGDVMLTTDVAMGPGPPAAEAEPAVAAILRVLALDPLRVCRRPLDEGIEKPDPESRCCLPSGMTGISAVEAEALAEVEDALEATEAFWAWRRRSSSRVRRLT